MRLSLLFLLCGLLAACNTYTVTRELAAPAACAAPCACDADRSGIEAEWASRIEDGIEPVFDVVVTPNRGPVRRFSEVRLGLASCDALLVSKGSLPLARIPFDGMRHITLTAEATTDYSGVSMAGGQVVVAFIELLALVLLLAT